MNRVRFLAAAGALATAILAGSAAAAPAPAAGDAAAPDPQASAPATAPAADAPDAFYVARMTIGEQALSAGRAAEAADNLRVASFGLLDQPEKLSECLVWLALAQQRAGRSADADATLHRFQTVQALFPSWSRLTLDPAMRSEFEALARKRLPGLSFENPREAERRANPAPVSPRPPVAEAAPPSPPPVAEAQPPARPPAAEAEAPPPAARTPERPSRPAPRVVPGPGSVPVALAKPPAPTRVPAPSAPAPSEEAAAGAPTASSSFPRGFADRELRTGRALIFEIRPDQARLFVDGRYVGVSADWGEGQGRPFPLSAGEHAVRAVLPGYRELRLRVIADPSLASDAVAAAELARIERRSFRRIPRPDYVTAGRIAFAPELRGAEVAVDGEPTGAADRFTVSAPMRLKGPAVHDVVISKPGRPARTIRVLASPTAASDLVVVRMVL